MSAKKRAAASGPGNKSLGVRKDQQLVFKGYLDSPFVVEWPRIADAYHETIRQQLKTFWVPPKIRKSPLAHESGEASQVSSKILPRSDLVLGINSVARALERDGLDLVLVCRSAQPLLLTRHLLLLAHATGTAVCALPDLSTTLGKLGGLPSATAAGIRKGSHKGSSTAALLQSLTPMLVPTSIAWMAQKAPDVSSDGRALTIAPVHPGTYARAALRRIGFPRKQSSKKSGKTAK
eukprot:m.190972 g.190972  ORF g.190972 m.190972 type:complete len:235 (-) comp18579_c0_seq1:115-819(-)